MREKFYCVEEVQIKENKILIPRQLRVEILESLRSSRQGVNGMLANTRQRLFRPGWDVSIRHTKAPCQVCNFITLSQPKRPLMLLSNPEFPFRQPWLTFSTYTVEIVIHTVALMSSGNEQYVTPWELGSAHIVHLKNFFLTGDHLLILKNHSLRLWEYGNILNQLTTHKAMVRQKWLSKQQSVYSGTTWMAVVSCVMAVQPVLCWPNATPPSRILTCLLLWCYTVMLA